MYTLFIHFSCQMCVHFLGHSVLTSIWIINFISWLVIMLCHDTILCSVVPGIRVLWTETFLHEQGIDNIRPRFLSWSHYIFSTAAQKAPASCLLPSFGYPVFVLMFELPIALRTATIRNAKKSRDERGKVYKCKQNQWALLHRLYVLRCI